MNVAKKLQKTNLNKEFNQGFQANLEGEGNAAGNRGRSIAFFMDDGSVDRKIIKQINVENRSITLYGPSFVDHNSTELVSGHAQLASNHSEMISLTEGKCVLEVSYPMVEPRFAMSTLYTEQESALDVVRELTAAFRTVLNYMNGQISFSPETLQEPVMLLLTLTLIKRGLFTLDRVSRGELPSQK